MLLCIFDPKAALPITFICRDFWGACVRICPAPDFQIYIGKQRGKFLCQAVTAVLENPEHTGHRDPHCAGHFGKIHFVTDHKDSIQMIVVKRGAKNIVLLFPIAVVSYPVEIDVRNRWDVLSTASSPSASAPDIDAAADVLSDAASSVSVSSVGSPVSLSQPTKCR